MALKIEQGILKHLSEFQDQLWMLQILQSSVGCGNSCSMCSQGASPGITRITRDSLSQILSGLKVLREGQFWSIGPLLWQNRSHKPWIIFPYLDTDVGSDPNLASMMQSLWDNFWCKTRISTVGFSRHNYRINQMHAFIANNLLHYLEGLRISLTPYTENFFSEDYPFDIANLLNLYLPLIDSQWVWRDIFACELRFPPLIELWEVQIWIFSSRFFIRSSDYLFITDKTCENLPDNRITGLKDRVVQFHAQWIPGSMYLFEGLSELTVEDVLSKEPCMKWDIYKVKNIDGEIFAVNPVFMEDWEFCAVHFLPRTATRLSSGVIDSGRPFLNAMIQYKKSKKMPWKWALPNGDIDDFLSFFQTYIQVRSNTQKRLNFWLQYIFPTILVAANIIKLASINNEHFFNPKFLVDTWHIVNQGRAKHIFQGLVSQSDEPITINEMKWYADQNSLGSGRGVIYRLAPTPLNSGGIRNLVRLKNWLVLSWLHHKWLKPIPEDTHFIPVELESIFQPKSEVISEFGIPGLPKNK